MKSVLLRTAFSAVVGGATIVTALTFNGGATLDNAKAKLNELTTTITQFANNEEALANKIIELKAEVDNLNNEIATGNGNAEDLQNQITTLNEEIATLESDLALQTEETNKANLEIEKANSKALELQVALDEHEANAGALKPMTSEEVANLTDGQETVAPPQEETGVYNLKYANVGETGTNGEITYLIREDGKIDISNTSSEDSIYQSPFWAFKGMNDPDPSSLTRGFTTQYNGNGQPMTIIIKADNGDIVMTINID